ncbi:cation diffusion facilitator family transporter [Palleronia aestuarii]|uniref:Protein p34 n=1 Tax=Palleronia aestuarii TaxID=568105 RepID=A0A2W7QB37_9RHOB|nr:cation diffusion facilitator family transporter [Palleronia aestuarii]PZX18959.1 cation diffusion facilitator family transporter [Palleronia aestuarii]
MTVKFRIGLLSVLVGLVVLAIKMGAYWLTGSVALLSDALESIVNVAAALAALAAIHVASQPADTTHPYGHSKAEFLSAVLEGLLIMLAALFILREAYHGIREPAGLDMPAAGLAVSLGATVINAFWSRLLIQRGHAEESPALVADGRHLLTDVITSLGVVAGVTLAVATGLAILDPIIAALVALHILWSGGKVVKESLSGLMDEAVPEERLEQIRDLIAHNAQGAFEAHDLRTRHAGSTTFIDFHLIVPGDMSVYDAHEICDRIESQMERELTDAQVTIHIEPEHKSKRQGVVIG